MTQKGKWKDERAQAYMSYKQAMQLYFPRQNLEYGAISVRILFIMPIPQSLSEKKRQKLKGEYHIKKPDIDNLIKGVFDAATGMIWKDDNQVVRCQALKIYGDHPGIEFEIDKIS